VVVDASVAARWFLLDENLVAESHRVLEDVQDDRIAMIEPGHFQIEVGNAVRNALRSNRLIDDSARQALAILRTLPAHMVPLETLLTSGFDTALRFDCALYDGLYLTLAEQLDCPFVHADQRLRNALRGRFPRELWIGEYAASH
jgi:predicted nucleic acid-binding protein